MPQIITNSFKSTVAERFVDSLHDRANASLYVFIGRPAEWSDEDAPPSPTDSTYNSVSCWRSAMALKRVAETEAKLVIPRHDWIVGTVYHQYDNRDTNLFGTSFYALTLPENRVYLCVSNNNGAASTVKPTGVSTSVFETSDGYKWKFMYALTDADLLRFFTANFMAVNENVDARLTAIGGSIENFEIVDGGTGYYPVGSDYPSNITVIGNGTGFAGYPIVNGEQGTITGIEITNVGNGYTIAKTLVTGLGTNANIRPIISPPKGHGYNNAAQLGASYVMINSRLDYAEGAGDFPTVNDYRRIGIIRNPLSYATGNVAHEATLDASYTMQLANVYGAYDTDEIIRGTNSNSNAIIVSATVNTESNTAIVRYSSTNSDTDLLVFELGETVVGNTNSTSGIITAITVPEVLPYTGEVLYTENRRKIVRASDQAENIHIVISF